MSIRHRVKALERRDKDDVKIIVGWVNDTEEEAAARHGLSVAEYKRQVENGAIRVIRLRWPEDKQLK